MLLHRIIVVGDLKQSLPDSIGNLTNLRRLELEIGSKEDQQLPATLDKLVNISRLELSLSGFTGEFPEAILKMKNLQHLSLTLFSEDNPKTPFHGPIHESFCDLDQLVELQMKSVWLCGLEICSRKLPKLEVLTLAETPKMSLPIQSLLLGRPMLRKLTINEAPVFGSLNFDDQIHLDSIDFYNTDISGTLPDSLWNNEKLVYLVLADTNLAGTLPNSTGKLGLLEYVDLRGNRISGSIPPEIGLCTSLHSAYLSENNFSGTLPSEIGNLSNLKVLDVSYAPFVGTIPNSFTQLGSLEELLMDFSNIEGTIPHGLLSLPNISVYTCTNCRLTGTIPDELSPTFTQLFLDSNFLQGSIPSSALSYCTSVLLSQNLLSGPIGQLSLNSKLNYLDLSGNGFTGSLPSILKAPPDLTIDLSDNHLSGSIPDHYRKLLLHTISLTNNQLEGEISTILEIGGLTNAHLGNNFFTGTIPSLPPTLVELSAFKNQISGTLDNIFPPGDPKTALSYLDLSHNLLEGSLPPIPAILSCNFISLASNNLTGSIRNTRNGVPQGNLWALDLSNNRLEGDLPQAPSFISLNLANNSFSGNLPNFQIYSRLSTLDISNNNFTFDASSITSHSFLSIFSAQNNRITGHLALVGLPSLKFADFSNNQITKCDFNSFYDLSQTELESISIQGNPVVESRAEFEQLIRDGVLTLSSTTTPSIEHQGVTCSQILIGNNIDTRFVYDETLFSYQQCRCDRDHFGLPPFSCHSCDTLKPGSTLCNGNVVQVEHNYYVYNNSKSLQTEMCASQFLYSINGHSKISNCLGLRIQYDYNRTNVFTLQSDDETHSNAGDSIFPSNRQLSLQCQVGSSGRLCARCNCDVTSNNSTCYFPGPAGICEKCGKVFSPNEFVPISLVILIVVVVVLSMIFYLILASKRRSKELEWKKLSIGRRIVYRLVDVTSFGQITIMVTFVQILVELTHWDVYALSGWLKVVNGESEGLGLRCLYPFLSNPVSLLVVRLLLPIIVILIVCTSIGLGELIHRLRLYLKHRTPSRSVNDSETISNDDDDDAFTTQNTSLINFEEEDERRSVPYPAMALATSTSISIVKFLYFGTTMAAVEYLFYTVQKGTNKKYVQSVPWMSFEDASVLRTISIPFMVLYLFGIPFGFVVVSWKLRHKISSPFVRLYFGSLFENYERHLFWWELVNMVRKLVVALLLRGLSPGDSFQPFFISLNIGFVGINVATMRPWKLGIENYLDGLGSVLLILSLASNLVGSLSHSRELRLIIAILDGLYVVVCLFYIVWRMIGAETSYEKEWKLKNGGRSHDSMNLVREDYGPPLLNNGGSIGLQSSGYELA